VIKSDSLLGDKLQAWQVGKETPIPDNFKMVEVAPFDLNQDGDVDGLAQTVKDFAPGGAVTIIDTMARATAGTDENSAKDMGLIIRAADRLATLTNGIVLLVHHTGKTEANGLRGSSALLGVLDSAIEVTGSKDTPRKFEIDKNKHGRDGEQYPFALAPVVIGKDEDGDEVTSCVVQSQAASPIETDPLKGSGQNQITALMAIRAVLLSEGAIAGTARYQYGRCFCLSQCHWCQSPIRDAALTKQTMLGRIGIRPQICYSAASGQLKRTSILSCQ